MSQASFTATVNHENFYKTYLSIMNGLLGLTSKELEVLTAIFEIRDLDNRTMPFLTDSEKNHLTLGTEGRKTLQRKLTITKHNLNNYFKALKDKGAIVEGKEGLELRTGLFIPKQAGSIVFNLKF